MKYDKDKNLVVDYGVMQRAIIALNIREYNKHKRIKDAQKQNYEDYYSWAGESIYYEDNPYSVESKDEVWSYVTVSDFTSDKVEEIVINEIRQVEFISSDEEFTAYLLKKLTQEYVNATKERYNRT